MLGNANNGQKKSQFYQRVGGTLKLKLRTLKTVKKS